MKKIFSILIFLLLLSVCPIYAQKNKKTNATIEECGARDINFQRYTFDYDASSNYRYSDSGGRYSIRPLTFIHREQTMTVSSISRQADSGAYDTARPRDTSPGRMAQLTQKQRLLPSESQESVLTGQGFKKEFDFTYRTTPGAILRTEAESLINWFLRLESSNTANTRDMTNVIGLGELAAEFKQSGRSRSVLNIPPGVIDFLDDFVAEDVEVVIKNISLPPTGVGEVVEVTGSVWIRQ